MLRVDPVADREKGLRSAARDAETGAWLIRGIRTEAEKSLVKYVENTGFYVMSTGFYVIVIRKTRRAGAPKHRQRFLSVRPGGWSRTPVNSSGTRAVTRSI